jgi:hypothetical protein
MKRIKKYSREILEKKIAKCNSDYDKLQLAENYGEEIRKRMIQLESLMGLNGKGYFDINGKCFPFREKKISRKNIFNGKKEIIKVIISFHLGLSDDHMDEFLIRNDRLINEYEDLHPPLYLSNLLGYIYKDRLAMRGAKMTGQRLTSKNKNIDLEILSIQKELTKTHGRCQKSGLSNAIRIYSNRNQLFWNDKKINSTQTSISAHQRKGKLPK